jgi:hypothetical protein
MPWTARDAHKHKKGLSARQARQWSHVANGVLQTCLNDGGSQSHCEGRAIREANSAVGTPEQSTNAQLLTVNTALTVTPSRLTLHNREYLTAPGVLLVAGVLNGALVQGEELIADDWNGVPVVIGHPRDAQGTPISARSPEVFAQYGVGTLYRARLGTGQRGTQRVPSLQAEIWLDCAQVQAMGGEALQAMAMLEAAQPVEVSTGFYAAAVPQPGTFYGTPYTEILVDLTPDHLALLPNEIGACNWDHGCGAPRLHQQGCDARHPCAVCAERSAMTAAAPPNRWQVFLAMLRQFVSQEDTTVEPVIIQTVPAELTTNQTDADVREALYGALAREMGTDYTPVFIDSIDSAMQAFVYRQGERLLQRRWTVDSAGILTLDPNTEDVQRSTQFTPVPGTAGTAEEPDDSNADMPMAMAAQPCCPACATALPQRSDGTASLEPCPQCAAAPAPPDTPVVAVAPRSLAKERLAMPTPAVSPIAIKARVNNLIANTQYGWTERDRYMLETMDEAFLIRLESQPILVPPPPPPEPPEPPKTAQEAIAQMPTHLQDMFVQMHRDYQERRQAALAILVAHKSCPFEQAELQEMSLERLEKLVAMGAGVEYSGKGLPAPRPTPVVEEAPPPPPNTMERVIERQKAQGIR